MASLRHVLHHTQAFSMPMCLNEAKGLKLSSQDKWVTPIPQNYHYELSKLPWNTYVNRRSLECFFAILYSWWSLKVLPSLIVGVSTMVESLVLLYTHM